MSYSNRERRRWERGRLRWRREIIARHNKELSATISVLAAADVERMFNEILYGEPGNRKVREAGWHIYGESPVSLALKGSTGSL